MTTHWNAVDHYFTLFFFLRLFFNFTQFVILENLSILDLALSGVKPLFSYRSSFNEINI